MRKVLVVYFSRSGHTRKVAEALAARCDADIEELRDVRDRTGIWGYIRSAREALKKRVIEIQTPRKNPKDYDLVILGTPVWAGNVCSPLRAYVAAEKASFARVAFFCTLGGSGAAKVFEDLADLCGKRPMSTLAVREAEIKKGIDTVALDRFIGAAVLPKAA